MTTPKLSKHACSGCGGPVLSPKLNWCSQGCVDIFLQGKVRSHWARKVYDRDKGICQLCGVDVNTIREPNVRSWASDHIIPLADDGPNTMENQRLLCVPCHKQVTKEWHEERKNRPPPPARCTGGCCEHIKLFSGSDPDHTAYTAEWVKAWLQQDLDPETHQVLSMFQPDPLVEGESQHWSCRNYSQRTGNCTIYHNRPSLCRDYPGDGGCHVKGCTLGQETPPGPVEDEGVVMG